jgi:hypothetical protein
MPQEPNEPPYITNRSRSQVQEKLDEIRAFRLKRTQERVASMEAKRRDEGRIVIIIPWEMRSGAERACIAQQGVGLAQHFRDLAKAFFEISEELPRESVPGYKARNRRFSAEEQKVIENLELALAESADLLPANGEVTMDQIMRDVLIVVDDDRSSRSFFGRAMLALGYRKHAIYDRGPPARSRHVYRKESA